MRSRGLITANRVTRIHPTLVVGRTSLSPSRWSAAAASTTCRPRDRADRPVLCPMPSFDADVALRSTESSVHGAPETGHSVPKIVRRLSEALPLPAGYFELALRTLGTT